MANIKANLAHICGLRALNDPFHLQKKPHFLALLRKIGQWVLVIGKDNVEVKSVNVNFKQEYRFRS